MQRGFGTNRVHSLADAVAKVITDYLNQQELQRQIHEAKHNGNGVTLGNGKANGNGQSISDPETEPETTGEPIDEPSEESQEPLEAVVQEIRRDICPKCGTASFVFEEGCKKCYSCGHSEC